MRGAAVVLVTGLLVLGAPTAARAETTLAAPERVTAAGVVELRATTDPSPDPTRLTLQGPGDTQPVVVATNADTPQVLTGGPLAFDLDTTCATYPAAGPCESPRIARNGVWTVALEGGFTASREVVIAVPAAAPAGVTLEPTGPTALVVRWARGVEPDVRWTLLEDRRTLVADLRAAGTCTGEVCEATLRYPATSARERTVTVRALRACPGCGGEPAGADSTATATLPDAPAGTTEPSTGAAEPVDGGAVQPNGQPVAEADRARAEQAFGTFVPRAAAPAVPDAFPGLAGPALPAEGAAPPPGPDVFDETLDYGEQERVVTESTSTPVIRTVTRAIGVVGGVLDSDRVARTGAGALLLLLAAAHLRVWVRSSRAA